MKEVDQNSDGQISLDEFKLSIKSGVIKNTVIWGLIIDDIKLQKGAKAALKRLECLNTNNTDNDDSVDLAIDDDLAKERQTALKSASVGGSIFLCLAVFRKFISKV